MLTTRQRQILGLFCSGRTGKQIAEELGLSPETINPSLKQSARRLGAPGIARATLREYATAAGEFSPDLEMGNGARHALQHGSEALLT